MGTRMTLKFPSGSEILRFEIRGRGKEGRREANAWLFPLGWRRGPGGKTKADISLHPLCPAEAGSPTSLAETGRALSQAPPCFALGPEAVRPGPGESWEGSGQAECGEGGGSVEGTRFWDPTSSDRRLLPAPLCHSEICAG